VLVLVIGIHLATLSQQASAFTGSITYTSEGLPIATVQSDTSQLHQNILASGAFCPIHSLGLFGVGSSESQ
jgi:hypothetical protein